MPPKRKKSVRQKQKQRQTQRQSVVVNIGKTTPAKKRKSSGRGRLPPPSYQQNLVPPTIIQQPNFANLENQISRLTSLIQPTQPIQNLNTPLNTNVQASSFAPSEQDIRDYEARLRSGEEAEKRRPGPTASNFQQMPSKSDEKFAQSVQDQDDIQAREDFELKQRQPAPEVPFAVVEKGGEIIPISFGTPKQGRPFQDLSKLTQAEPIGPPIADANRTVNLAQAEALDPQGITSFKQQEKGKVLSPPIRKKSTKDLPLITSEQLKEFKHLQKRASLTPEEEKTRKDLRQLAIKSGKVHVVSKPKGVALKSPNPLPKRERVPTPPGFYDDFLVGTPPSGERSSDENIFVSDEGI